MQRRRVLLIAGLAVVIVLVVVFVLVGVPLIMSTFATPIPGLPTESSTSGGSSLRDRFTQTAAARKAATTPAAGATSPVAATP